MLGNPSAGPLLSSEVAPDNPLTIGGQQIAVGGDVILSVDDMPVGSDDNVEKIRNRLAAEPSGTPFKMKVLRTGKIVVLVGKTP